jgi:hypothetical protein
VQPLRPVYGALRWRYHNRAQPRLAASASSRTSHAHSTWHLLQRVRSLVPRVLEGLEVYYDWPLWSSRLPRASRGRSRHGSFALLKFGPFLLVPHFFCCQESFAIRLKLLSHIVKSITHSIAILLEECRSSSILPYCFCSTSATPQPYPKNEACHLFTVR